MKASRRAIIGSAIALGASRAMAKSCDPAGASLSVERWGTIELTFQGPRAGNPFVEVELAAVISVPGVERLVPGFYDGDGTYRIRFSPSDVGVWRWTTRSNVAALDGRNGSFSCTAPGRGNHGPVQISENGFHFTYADGTPYRQIGTTSYSWALQSEAKCAATLKTLAAAPFNKMRMCVFPNVASVATNPFIRTGEGPREWDASRFDPAYFRRFEDRIRRLGSLGIEADIILFHPYDKVRGYSDLQGADAERYLRYVAARFGAYRNVWWSMANEYDDIADKSVADWDRLFQCLVSADVHDRLRSIHQIHAYYDVRKPWITHASIQNGSAVKDDGRAVIHRLFAQKPVIFDEVCYEGNSTKRWGKLSGEDLVERFWWGTIAGTYVGHSETIDPNQNADTSWLGQGGALHGTSAPRLAFLRHIMENGPREGIEPIQEFWDYHLGGKPGAYYLTYFGKAQTPFWPVLLPGKASEAGAYRAEIIDTWGMTIDQVPGLFHLVPRDDYDLHDPAKPEIQLPAKPFLAIRLTRAS